MDIRTPINYEKLNRNYKYKLNKTCCIYVGFPGRGKHDYFTLYKGYLWIKKGYCWDGATMFPDFESIIKPSLLHDCLYQMIKSNLLEMKCRREADVFLRKMCIVEGMWPIVAWVAFTGVTMFGTIAIKFR
jgi:hypothetical protein